MSTKIVIHRDGTQEPFKTEKIIKAIEEVTKHVPFEDQFIPLVKILKNFELKLPQQVKTEEIDQLLLKAIEPLITDDPLYDDVATAQLVKIINKEVNKQFSSFADYIHWGVKNGLLNPKMEEFNLGAIELSINYEYDQHLNYFGLSIMKDRYLTKDHNKKLVEKPQWMWMRIAMGLSLTEQNKEELAIKIYNQLAQLKYVHSTPTLFNSGMKISQLSSCYVNVVGDSLESIMDKAKETAFFAKYAGGVGTYFGKLRASGSHIKTLNSKSSWPIPFIKIYDTVINAVVQWGRRRASDVIYMEPWHYNFTEFLDLKETNGNDYLRTRALNTASWIPDEFMARVEQSQDWYMFDPKECPGLVTKWWKEFSKYYAKCIQKAEKWELKLWKKMRAVDLYKEILIRLAKTGNYWITFKDRFNEKNPAPEYSIIHSSNLCTEIGIPNSETSTAVCNLASINLSKFVKKPHGKAISELSFEEKLNLIDWEDLKKTVQVAIQALDNVIDINFYPSKEARKNSQDLRPIWLGIMGLAEMFIDLHIPYESADAVKLSDKLGEFIYNTALQTSEELAQKEWAFPFYEQEYAKWEKPPYKPRKNLVLMAIAPTSSISLIAGTSSTIDPYFANVYSRETLSGKFTIIIKNLINQLKEKGLWNEEIKSKIINAWGSIQHISELDEVVDKNLFKTAYEISPFAQIDIAAAWQKWVDQSISRNMYLKEELRDNMEEIYLYAWKKGLKATYYCFIEKKIQGEKYTQKVNKRGARKGFGVKQKVKIATSLTDAPKTKQERIKELEKKLETIDPDNPTPEEEKIIEEYIRLTKGDEYFEKLRSGELYGENACPTDPFEKVMCESCQ